MSFNDSEERCIAVNTPIVAPRTVIGTNFKIPVKSIFLHRINWIVLVIEEQEAENLFVPKARCIGNPKRIKAGMLIKPPPPAIASTKEANSPAKHNNNQFILIIIPNQKRIGYSNEIVKMVSRMKSRESETKRERIQKVLARAGIASRRKIEEYIQQGLIAINGKIIQKPGETVDIHTDTITFKGKMIQRNPKKVYYVLNKPKFVLSTCYDEEKRKTVLDFFRSNPYRLFPVGRLDYLSEGLIFLTNDGDFAYHLTHPKHDISKQYLVQIKEKISQADINLLSEGMVLEEYKTKPCKVRVVQPEKKGIWLEIILFEGRNRQIRKMIEQLGKHVVSLTRTRIGICTIGNLMPGEHRSLTKEEVDYFLLSSENKETA